MEDGIQYPSWDFCKCWFFLLSAAGLSRLLTAILTDWPLPCWQAHWHCLSWIVRLYTEKYQSDWHSLYNPISDKLKSQMGLEHTRHRSPTNAFVHVISCLIEQVSDQVCSGFRTRIAVKTNS